MQPLQTPEAQGKYEKMFIVLNIWILLQKSLKWGPWFWHYTTKSGRETLRSKISHNVCCWCVLQNVIVWLVLVFLRFRFTLVADYLGEKLAWFFGITSPKYQSAIDEYNRMQKQVRAYSLWRPRHCHRLQLWRARHYSIRSGRIKTSQSVYNKSNRET